MGFAGRLSALLLGVLVWQCAVLPSAKAPSKRPIEFTISTPGAKSVAVAGSFNGWSMTAHQMQPSGKDGKWSATIPLSPGEYHFMYVINGRDWKTPPVADDFIDDGYGQINGVVVVR